MRCASPTRRTPWQARCYNQGMVGPWASIGFKQSFNNYVGPQFKLLSIVLRFKNWIKKGRMFVRPFTLCICLFLEKHGLMVFPLVKRPMSSLLMIFSVQINQDNEEFLEAIPRSPLLVHILSLLLILRILQALILLLRY